MLSTQKLTPEQHLALEKIAQKRAALGLSTPMWDERPAIFSDIAWIWEAFQDLCKTRSTGWGVSPIVYTEILAWSDLHGVPQDVRVRFTRWIKALDAIWLKSYHKQQQTEKK